MTIRRILVPVRGDGKGEGVLDHAVSLARRFQAHVDVLHCRARPEDMLPFGVSVPAMLRKDILASAGTVADQEERKVRDLFDAYCERNGLTVVDGPSGPADQVSLSWREKAGKQAAVIAVEGRLADLIAVAQPDRARNLGLNSLEAALLETGKQVLLCPPQESGSVETVGAHIAIAWNGSAEAARAVAIGLPLLAAAERVTVIALSDDTRTPADPVGPEALQGYLASHGIEAGIEAEKSKAAAVGGALLKIAHGCGADLLLMGAYGQSRRRELVLGGVTQHVIEHADLPVLLTH